jgi:hypothetical protein
MQDHTFIGEFMGIWPSEKSLTWWIREKWNPQCHIDLKLDSKGFFTIIFSSMEDHDRVFENYPYLFNYVGFHFIPWTERFSSEKEGLIVSHVWICLYSLSPEF